MKYKYIGGIILFIVVLLGIEYYKFRKRIYSIETIKLENIVSSLRTGDIIFYRYDNWKQNKFITCFIMNTCQTFLSTIYTHCSIVIRINDIPFLYTAHHKPEYDYITKTYKSGSMLIDSKKYLMAYQGHVVLYKIKKRLRIGNKLKGKIIDYLHINKSKQFEDSIPKNLNTIFKITEYEITDKIMCCQIVGDILKLLKLFPKFFHTSIINLSDIITIADMSKKYKTPVIIKNLYFMTD